MKTPEGNWQSWDINIDSLAPLRETSSLSEIEIINIYDNLTNLPGQYSLFVGYRNTTDTLSYNATPINLSIIVDQSSVLKTYARIAQAGYEDSLFTAKQLETKIKEFLANPSPEGLEAAKVAWIQARAPYLQTEAYRFGNSVVDDWEGKVNAWPLDEGLIDYVDTSTYINELGNEWAQANIVANNGQIDLAGEALDASTISSDLLESLHEISGSEANVATGYHAVEFLLWGQDLNGTEAGAGERSYTDYISGSACTNGNCDRRKDYLLAATELLISDLEYITDQWNPNGGITGTNYATEFIAGDVQDGIRKMLFGIGSLSFGELAGERMKVALIANSTEDEHDCFSDNTHESYYYDALGIKNVFTGQYRRTDGTFVSGPSIADLVGYQEPATSEDVVQKMDKSIAAIQKIVNSAESGVAFDQLIAPGNNQGATIVQDAINALGIQTLAIEKAAEALGITDLNPDLAGHEL